MMRYKLLILTSILLVAVATFIAFTQVYAGDNNETNDLPPWVGLQMKFESNTNGTPENRIVTFLAEDSVGNIIIRDSTPTSDGILYVDPQTREVNRCDSPLNNFFLCTQPQPVYVEYWVSPSKLKIGETIQILDFDGEVIDRRKVSIMGKKVDGFVVQARLELPSEVVQDTWVYESKSGQLLAASFVSIDPNTEDVFFSVGLQLTHTNQGFIGLGGDE